MPETNGSPNARIAIFVAIIGAVATLSAAVVGGLFAIQAAQIQANNSATSTTVTMITPTVSATNTPNPPFTPQLMPTMLPSSTLSATNTPRRSLTPKATFTTVPASTLEPTEPTLTAAAREPIVPSWSMDFFPSQAEVNQYLSSTDAHFYLAHDSILSNDEAAQRYDNPIEEFNNYLKWGRLTKYVRYFESTCGPFDRVLLLSNSATLFKGNDGAAKSWGKSGYQFKAASVSFESSTEVGDEAFIAIEAFQGCDNGSIALRGLTIGFHRNNVEGLAAVTGVSGRISDKELRAIALRYARLLDFRILRESK